METRFLDIETKKNTVDEKEIIEFKSYYVVWKQKINGFVPSTFEGLNRTMQYGNCLDLYFSNILLLV